MFTINPNQYLIISYKNEEKFACSFFKPINLLSAVPNNLLNLSIYTD